MSKRFIKPSSSISRTTPIDSDSCRLPTTIVLSNKEDKSRSHQFWSASHGHVMQKNKENCSIEVHGGGGLELVKPTRKPASSRPKTCASLKNTPSILPDRRSLLALVGRKHIVVRISFPLRSLPVCAFDSRAQGFIIPLGRRRSSCPPPSSNLVLTHPIERATVRLRVLQRPTRLFATVSPASRVPPPPEGHQVGARKRRIG